MQARSAATVFLCRVMPAHVGGPRENSVKMGCHAVAIAGRSGQRSAVSDGAKALVQFSFSR